MKRTEVKDRLKRIRGDTPVKDFATKMGLSPSAIRMYEHGERVPRDDVKAKYARLAGKTVDEIFFSHIVTKR